MSMDRIKYIEYMAINRHQNRMLAIKMGLFGDISKGKTKALEAFDERERLIVQKEIEEINTILNQLKKENVL